MQVSGFSAHADFHELLRWLDGFATPPCQTLLVHGETLALESLRQKIAARGWAVAVPRHLETVQLAS
jgi:metallo-beta-lactamase family protein